MAKSRPTGEAQADMVCRAAAEWAVTDQDSALKWAGQIADEALFQRVMGQIAVGSAEQDPIGAATIALRDMSQGLDQDRVIVSIVERWVQTDPKAASAWVSQFPEDNLGRYGVESLVNLWADRYLITSGVWLRTLPAGALRDAGILAYSRVVRRTDPELADRWASSIARRQ